VHVHVLSAVGAVDDEFPFHQSVRSLFVRRSTRTSGIGIVAYTPNPAGRVQPGVGHARMEDVPGGDWTSARHVSQKKFVRFESNAPRIAAGCVTVPVDMGRDGNATRRWACGRGRRVVPA